MVNIVEPATANATDVLPYGGHLDALALIFAEWATVNGFEQDDGDAAELLMFVESREQREWLAAFVVIWDHEQDRIDALPRA